MFTTKNAKKILFTLIGTLYVFCLFLMSGCSRGIISELDKQEIRHRLDMRALERKNDLLTKKNSKLVKENEKLKERVTELEAEVNPEPPKEEIPLPPGRIGFKADRKLGVGDKLPNFTIYDIVEKKGVISFGNAEATISGRKYGPNTIHFKEKGSWFELKNGTRYICTTQGGCIIDSINLIITKGKIKVAYKNHGK